MTQTLAKTNHTARALSLLGSGVSVHQTAAALGVSDSAISQLLADEAFSEEVIKLRYENLQAHNERDATYDSLEDRLLQKLQSSLSFLVKPDQILRAIKTINGAKRRGQSGPQQVSESATIISLTMPVRIVQKITTNIDNQVVQVGDQHLHTIDSNKLIQQIRKPVDLIEQGDFNEPSAEVSTA